MAHSSSNVWSGSLCRVIGYGLLAVAFFNVVDIFVPSDFTNSTWQFNTVGTLIERMPVALVGTLFAFWGGTDYRSRWEQFLLRLLSWSTLVIGILFLLLVPLVVRAAMVIDAQNMLQINAQYDQQISQLEQVQTQLNTATGEQVNSLIEILKSQNPSLNINSSGDLQRQVVAEVTRAKKTALANSESNRNSQRLTLRKTVVKWSLSALISAFLFFSIWRMTQWARRFSKARTIAQTRG